MSSSKPQCGIDGKLSSMELICRSGCRLDIKEILRNCLISMMWIFKEEEWELLRRNLNMCTMMVCKCSPIILILEFLILQLIKIEPGINV